MVGGQFKCIFSFATGGLIVIWMIEFDWMYLCRRGTHYNWIRMYKFLNHTNVGNEYYNSRKNTTFKWFVNDENSSGLEGYCSKKVTFTFGVN